MSMSTPTIHTRSEWTRRAARGVTRLSWPSIRVVDIHWPARAGRISRDLGSIKRALLSWQRFHMDTRGWRDIAYNVAVDLNGDVWELRGWDVQDGGVAGRSDDVTILLVMGDKDTMTDAMKWSVLWAMGEFERRKGGTLRRSYHGALSSTSCPGPEATRWARAGFPPPNTAVVPDAPPRVAVPKIEGVKPRAIPVNAPDAVFVRIIQEITGAAVDGQRGPKTIEAVKRLQRRLGVKVDGVFGPGTAEAYLLSVPNLYKGRGGMSSAAVKLVQWIVRSRVDGKFGDLTVADVKSAQVWAGLTPDGNVGDETKKRVTI